MWVIMNDLLKWLIAPFRFLIWFFWELLFDEIIHKLQQRYPILKTIIFIVVLVLLVYMIYTNFI